MYKNIGIASDHAGFEMKENILISYPFLDLGTNSQESCDYPIIASNLCSHIDNGRIDRGILICGSGVGMAIAANRRKNIRAANCWSPEVAVLARQHNDINVLVLPAKFINIVTAVTIINSFINTDFSGEERHLRRIGLLGE